MSISDKLVIVKQVLQVVIRFSDIIINALDYVLKTQENNG